MQNLYKWSFVMIFQKAGHFSLFMIAFLVLLLSACGPKKIANPVFEVLEADRTGISFSNKLTPTADFNMFTYMYYYNGAGVGAGDFNNDGKIDLFFAANQEKNRLYLNTGNLKFKDVTEAAHIPMSGWSTGVSVADVNNDGLLDIYICKVGNYQVLKSKNQLLICQGIDKNGVPYYKDEAPQYGLDFSGFSTQALFFDYDMDGDLDMFLLNHSVHQDGNFSERKNFLGTYHPLSGDRIYRNEGNHFTDVTRATGINSSEISYGLGMAASDIDLDGYPDLYVGNDFHENDYLYINQHNGTFKEELTERIMHTSQFSMGIDVADINNDAYPEIISMDMLPANPYILKRSLGEDEYDIFNLKVSYGYNYQYTRNNLQLNRRNGFFSEVGLYAGVYATDWSWSPLWMDFDNDGLKDLFISNGIPKRMNDMDYVNYVSSDAVQDKIRTNNMKSQDMSLLDKFPQIKLPNKFFRNKGAVSFQDLGDQIQNDKATYSNGAVYADLDGDGDLDIVVNNIDGPALVYENKVGNTKPKSSLEIKLKGAPANVNAVGAKAIVFTGKEVRTYEKFPIHGFQSSTEIPLHIGLANTKVDSMFLIWPDNTYQPILWKRDTTQITLQYQSGLPHFNYQELRDRLPNPTAPVTDITKTVNLNYLHQENAFNEFDREPLIPHMVSREGPALAVGDANGDGLEDVFIGSSKGTKSALFFQQPSGKFQKTAQPDLERDSVYEDVSACWADVNGDEKKDLVVASGGNEYYGQEPYLTPRVYLNDGHGQFKKLPDAFNGLYLTASCVVPYDFNGDGYTDLFIGGRAVPWAYGQIPESYLLENDKQGHFKDVTAQYSKELSHAGFVTNAVWCDLDGDKDQDLVLSLEWGGINAFINERGHFTKKLLTDKNGWWNFTLPCDIDGDGDTDFIAGNLGLNSRLQPSQKEPVRLYYNDFDDNGRREQLLTYYLAGREIPFPNKDELQKQIPVLKKKYLYAEDFAKATLQDIFTPEKLKDATVLTADYFPSSVLINNGNLNFTLQPLPWEAQLTPYKDAVLVNANGDNLPDVLLVGNFYENNIQMGRYDADYGTLLINGGNGRFTCQSLNGLSIKGQVRHIRKISIADKEAFVLARNNDSAMVIQFQVLK